MPQLYIAVAVISLMLGKLKDLFASINISDTNKKVIRWGLIGLLMYFLYRIIEQSVNKSKVLADVNGGIAVELHNAIYAQAMNVHVPFLGDFHLGNGDERAVLVASAKITDYNQVAKYYKTLYGLDLYADLEKVLTAEEIAVFNENVQKKSGKAPNTPTKKGTTPPVNPKTTTVNSNVGRAVYCTSETDVNVRNANDPSKVLYKINKHSPSSDLLGGVGYVGNYVKTKKLTLGGKDYWAWEVDIPFAKQGFNYGLNGLIVSDYATFK